MPAKAAPNKNLQVTEVKEWMLPGFDEPFEQDPLTFFEKTEFMGVLSNALDLAMKRGLEPGVIAELAQLSEDQLRNFGQGGLPLPALQGLAQVVLRIFTLAPELMLDVYLIALSVPPRARPGVREVLMKIDDETGFGIFETFIDQNLESLRDFTVRFWTQLKDGATKVTKTTTDDPEEEPSAP